jgi:general secretion pathway protein C
MELLLQRYSWAAGVLAAIACAYLAARTVSTIAASAIAPKPALLQQAGNATAQPQSLAQHTELDADLVAKLFNVPLPKPVAADAAPAVSVGPVWNPVPTRTSLRGSLIGTSVADPPEYSLCEIMNPDLGEPQVFTVGAGYLGARIYQIDKDRVLFVNNGVNEYMDNGAPAVANLGVVPVPPPANDGSVKQLSENQYVIAKSTINDALTNLSQLATQARIVPSFKNGVANGFKLFSIVPDSLYSKIGVQNGDVIHRINGYEMSSPDKALEIYQKLRDASRIEIELERRGDTVHKSYSIE